MIYNSLLLLVLLPIFFAFHLTLTSVSALTPTAQSQTQTQISPSTESKRLLDAQRLRSTIANGRVYQQEHFIDEDQVQVLLQDIERLCAENKMIPSGLSNTLKERTVEGQNFGSADRTTAPVPWWNDVLSYDSGCSPGSRSGSADGAGNMNNASCDSNNENILQSIIDKIHSLQVETSEILQRPTMKTHSPQQHECYYSRSTVGSLLPRHMDERHEELKGPRGWMMPTRRSISWLIYLSDDELEGGELRAFPQHNFVVDVENRIENGEDGCGEGVFVGSHGGNLQIGWIDMELQGKGTETTLPVYLDSWFNVQNSKTGESEPHCILYTVIADVGADGTQNILYITKPWNNDSIQMATSDFIKKQAEVDSNLVSSIVNRNNSKADSEKSDTTEHKLDELLLFVNQAYAKGFRLLEDRQSWAEGKDPEGSSRQDVVPKRGSLVMFDSVSVPHEVMMVKKNTRAALAGWFHEETQQFPVNFA